MNSYTQCYTGYNLSLSIVRIRLTQRLVSHKKSVFHVCNDAMHGLMDETRIVEWAIRREDLRHVLFVGPQSQDTWWFLRGKYNEQIKWVDFSVYFSRIVQKATFVFVSNMLMVTQWHLDILRPNMAQQP